MNKYKFIAGERVRVVNGTLDPDFGFDISGWSGEIGECPVENAEELICGVNWDSDTINRMGEKFI